jgi:hypothetical protein
MVHRASLSKTKSSRHPGFPGVPLRGSPLLGFSLSDGHSIRGMLLSSIDLIEPLLQFPVDRILTCTYKDSIDYTFHRGFGFHFRRAPQIRGLRSAGFRLPRSGNPRADFIEIQSRLLAMSPTSVSSPMRLERRDASIRDRFIEPSPPPLAIISGRAVNSCPISTVPG